jgi:serine phosphatase RsbU (regulator of sigma subunit)
VGEQFGDDRLLEAIARGRSEPLQEAVTALVAEIERWCGASGAQDDVSILVVEISAVANPG